MVKYSITIPTVYLASSAEDAELVEGASILVEDRPMLLADMLSALRDLELNILYVFHSERVNGTLWVYLIFKVKDKRLAKSRIDLLTLLRERLFKIREVKKVELAEKRGRLLLLRNVGGFSFLGRPSVIIGKAHMAGLTAELSKWIGKDVAYMVAYHIGRSVGKALAETYANIRWEKLEDALFFLKSVVEGSSYVEVLEWHIESPQRFEIVAINPWECDIIREYGMGVWDEPYYLINIISEFLEKLLGKLRIKSALKWEGTICELTLRFERTGSQL